MRLKVLVLRIRAMLWVCFLMVCSCATTGPHTAKNKAPDAVALFNQGVSLEDEGKPDAALAMYQASIQADPRLIPPRHNRNILLVRRGELSRARREAQDLRDVYLNHAMTSPGVARRAGWGIARSFFVVGLRDEARDVYVSLIKGSTSDGFDPVLLESILDLGRMYSDEPELATLLEREIMTHYRRHGVEGVVAPMLIREQVGEALYRALLRHFVWMEQNLKRLETGEEEVVQAVLREFQRLHRQSLDIARRLEKMQSRSWSYLGVKVQGDLRMQQARLWRALPCPEHFARERCKPHLATMMDHARMVEHSAASFYVRALKRGEHKRSWPSDLQNAHAWIVGHGIEIMGGKFPPFRGPAVASLRRHPVYHPQRDQKAWRLGSPFFREL